MKDKKDRKSIWGKIKSNLEKRIESMIPDSKQPLNHKPSGELYRKGKKMTSEKTHKLDKKIQGYEAIMALDETLKDTIEKLKDANKGDWLFEESDFKRIIDELTKWMDFIGEVVGKMK